MESSENANILPEYYNHPNEQLDIKINYNNDKMLARHTSWIARASDIPIIDSIWGIMINQHCHVFDSYSKDHRIVGKN